MSKLMISQLRKIIAKEVFLLREGEKEDQAAAMAISASKLLKAIEAFKLAASAKAKSSADSAGASLEKHLQEAEKMLKRIVSSPMQHVDGKKPVPSGEVSQSTASDQAQTKKVSIDPSTKAK